MSDGLNLKNSVSVSIRRGSSVGRYVILGLVGRGAMGEVYAAYDPDLDRKVAVKLLHAETGAVGRASSSDGKLRLLREAQAIARLSHPNIIVVHDAGSFDERVFVAMEFVDGNTVGYWLQSAARDWKDVMKVFLAAGRGLAAAHAAQLVHRDFKMENVMIGRDGSVRVMDFGLARRVSGEGDGFREDGVFTPLPDVSMVATSDPDDVESTMRILADPSTAPQQPPKASATTGTSAASAPSVPNTPTGKRRALHPGIDTTSAAGRPRFLLGEVEALDGSHTLRPKSTTQASLTQTGAVMGTPAYMSPEQFMGHPADARSDQFSFCVALYEALYGERPFVGKTVRALADAVTRGQVPASPASTRVPSWIRKIIVRGLRRKPEERWPSMEALLSALERDPRVRWWQAAAATVAVAVVAGISLGIRHQAQTAYRPSCQVTADRFGGVWEIAPAAGQPGGRRRQIEEAFHATKKAYAATSFTATASALDKYVRSWSSMYGDACQATYVRGEQSADLLDLRMACLRDRWGEVRALSDLLAHADADLVANSLKAAAALTSLDRCADVRALKAAVPPPTDPELRRRVEALTSQSAAVKAMTDAGQYSRAISAAAQLASDARATGYVPLLAESLYRLGLIQVAFQRGEEAEKTLDEAVWLAEASRRDEIVATASVEQIFNVGYLQKDLERARRWKRQAEAFLDRMGGHDLERSWMANNYGAALQVQGDMEGAVENFRLALRIKERILDPSDPDIAQSLTNLASGLAALGKYEEALVLSNRGVEICTATLGWDRDETATQLVNRAELLNLLGRFSDARRDATQARGIWERQFGHEYSSLSLAIGLQGEATLGLEQPEAAIALLERALEIAKKHDQPLPVARLNFALARALWDSGHNPQKARQLAMAVAKPKRHSNAQPNATSDADPRLQSQANEWLQSHSETSLARPAAFGRPLVMD